MKRIGFNAFVAFCMYCIFYKLGFFEFFFMGGGKMAIAGISILIGVFLSSSISLHIFLDHWISYEQEVEFIIAQKKIISREINSTGENIRSGIYMDTYYFTFSRKGSPEEVFEKEVRMNVYNSFEEGAIVKVNKRRTIVDTHYKVIKEKDIPQMI